MSKITLYHYTNKAGAEGIDKSKVIKGSTYETPAQNRRHGTGVYFTSIAPNKNPKSILLNNYDDAGHVVNSKRLWAKIEWVVEVTIPVSDVEKVEGQGNRDIYLYRGDVKLSGLQYSIYENPYV